MSEFTYNPTSADLAALDAVRGAERLARMAEQMDGPEYDVLLRHGDAVPLFSVREMSCPDGVRFGVRHDEFGLWHPMRLASRERAEWWRDALLLSWCEGNETLLADAFALLRDEEARP